MSKELEIVITAKPSYVADQSDPVRQKFVWSYEVSIENKSHEVVQLLHRFWLITDATGRADDIHGLGVIGMQPVIKPGRTFIYTSFCQLPTPQGVMEGRYEFQKIEDEAVFDVKIPKFILMAPMSITKVFRSKLH